MKITKHHDLIWEIENFLYDDEISHILNYAYEVPDIEWWNGRNHMPTDPLCRSIIVNITRRSMCYFENSKGSIGINDIQKLVPGAFIDLHQDFDTSDRQENIIYGGIVYLNDNYEGGEIYYPEIDYKVKPKRSSLIIHKAEYLHKVLSVESGTRYMMTLFITGDESTKCILK